MEEANKLKVEWYDLIVEKENLLGTIRTVDAKLADISKRIKDIETKQEETNNG